MGRALDRGLAGVGTPPVFCERVRKLLSGEGLRGYSFWKSAQECENKRVDFWRFLGKSKKSAGESLGGGEALDGRDSMGYGSRRLARR